MSTAEEHHPEEERPLWLLASLGMRKQGYSPAVYALPGREWKHECCFAPVATGLACEELLGRRPERLVVAATEQARERHGDELEREARDARLPAPAHVRIPPGRDQQELEEIARRLSENVDKGVGLALDLTLGFRHLPLLFLAAAGVLRESKDVSIEGVLYGAFDLAPGDKAKPILDLTWVVELFDLFHACRSLQEAGDVRRLAGLLDEKVRALGRLGRLSPRLGRLASVLREGFVELRAPLSPQLLARSLFLGKDRNPSHELSLIQHEFAKWSPLAAPLVAESVQRLMNMTLEPRTFEQSGRTRVRSRGPSDLELSRELLERQRSHVDWLLEMEEIDGAARLAREWAINRVLAARGVTGPGEWLRRDTRCSEGERPMQVLQEWCKDADLRAELPEAQCRLGSAWSSLRDVRNALAHAGHGLEVPAAKDLFQRFKMAWGAMKSIDEDEVWGLAHASIRPVVVTPLGRARGILHTLVKDLGKALEPEEVEAFELIVVCSREVEEGGREALAHAGFTAGGRVRFVHVEDPFSCFGEGEALWPRGGLGTTLVRASKLVVNLAGGTTALQSLVLDLERRARQFGPSVIHVACVDRRPREEQEIDPFGGGELIVVSREAP